MDTGTFLFPVFFVLIPKKINIQLIYCKYQQYSLIKLLASYGDKSLWMQGLKETTDK